MLSLTLAFSILLQSEATNELPIFKIVLILAGSIFATYVALRVGLTIMGGSLTKAEKKPILKRIVDNSKR